MVLRKTCHELLTPLKVRVSQMLLPNCPAAKDLETQINQGGDFGKFAQRYSIDNKTKAERRGPRPLSKGAGQSPKLMRSSIP